MTLGDNVENLFFNPPVVFGSKMTFLNLKRYDFWPLWLHTYISNKEHLIWKIEEELFRQKMARWHGPHRHMTTRTGWQDDSRSHKISCFPCWGHFTCSSHQLSNKIIPEMKHLRGLKKYWGSWKSIDEINLHAFIGLLILAGVYRSGGEAASRLWDAERQFLVFFCNLRLDLNSFFLSFFCTQKHKMKLM